MAQAPTVQAAPAKRAHQEDPARRKPVGDGEQGKHQRADDEAELQRRGERTHRRIGPAQLALQVGHHGIDRKPQRGARKLGEHQHGQDVARDVGLGHGAQLKRLEGSLLAAQASGGVRRGYRAVCRPAAGFSGLRPSFFADAVLIVSARRSAGLLSVCRVDGVVRCL